MPELDVPVTDMQMFAVLSERVDGDLLEKLAFGTDMRWVAASEPRERLDSSATFFVGVTLSGEVTLAAQLDTGMLVGMPVDATFAQASTEVSTLLLSGTDHMLYRLGPGQELEWMHLPSRERASVALTDVLGTVQSATLLDGPNARALLVDTLDDTQRVIRVDLRDGKIEVLATYGVGGRERHDLSTLPDGHVVITGWTEGVETFAAFVLEVTDEGALIEVRGYEGGDLMLGSLRASAEGLSYLLADGGLMWRPDGVPFAAMEWLDASGQLEQAF